MAQLALDAPWVLQGTLVVRRLRCRREDCPVCQEHGGHGPFYYLSRRGEGGKTQMVYVARARLGEVRAGLRAFARLKKALGTLAGEDLVRWRREARRRPR